MKIVLNYLLVLLVITAVTPKPHSQEEMKMLELLMADCMVQESATEDDLNTMMNYMVPPTKERACFNACVMEKSGIIENGRVSIENSIEAAKKHVNSNPTKVEINKIIIPGCVNGATSSDRCEHVYQFLKCSDDAAVALDMTARDLLTP